MLMGFVTNFIQTKAVMVAMEKLGSMLAGPIGALWQVLSTAWSIFQTVKEKFDQLKGIVSGIFGSIAAIARGAVGGAISTIVGVLVKGLGVAINLLSRIARLGGIPKKIKKFLSNLRGKIQGAIEKLIKKVVGKVKGLFKGGKGRDKKGKDKDTDGPKLPKPTSFTTKDGHKHKVWVENKGGKLNTRVASTPKDVDKQISDWKKDAEEAPKESKGKISSAIGAVTAADSVIDGKAVDKLTTAKVEAGQKKLAVAAKKAFDEVNAASNTDDLPGGDYPKTNAEYIKWLKAEPTFAKQLKQLQDHARDFAANDKKLARTTQKLEILFDGSEGLDTLRDKAKKLEDDLGPGAAKAKKKLDAEIKAIEDAAPSVGMTMPELLDEAKELAKQIQKGGEDAKHLKVYMEGVMQAVMLLSKQIDKIGTGEGRTLYESIDKGKLGHTAILSAAAGAGVGKADQSKLAVNYRNWLRVYFRNDVMTDSNAAEVLFLRDFAKTGQYSGLTWEQVRDKVIKSLKKPDKKAKEDILADNFDFDTATPAELDKIYGGIIGSSKKTNAGASANAGAVTDLGKDQFKDEEGGSHTLTHTTAGKVKADDQPPKKVLPKGEAWKLADKIDADTEAYIGENPKRSAEAGSKTLRERIKADRARLLVLMKSARGVGEDGTDVAKLRDGFESELAKRAAGYKWANNAASYMADKAWSLMALEIKPTLEAAEKIDRELIKNEGLMEDPDFKKLVKSCGLDLNIGFGGAVGKSFDRIEKVLKSGNLRTKVQHVMNFGDKWAAKVFDQRALAVRKTLAAVGIRADDIRALHELRKLGIIGKGKKNAKGVFSGAAGTKETKDANKEYLKGKSGSGDMDRKFPTLPLDTLTREELVVLARRHDLKPREDTPTKRILEQLKKLQGLETGGQGTPVMSTRTTEEAGVELSADEKRAHSLKEGLLPFMEGTLANLVDENHEWISEARGMDMPLKAGISGTTQRWMHFSKLMSAPDLYSNRLAIYAWAVPINAHSYHEVMAGAKTYCEYTSKKGGGYYPFRPLNITLLRKAAEASGVPKERVDEVLGIKK
jgi:hypothetical protein